MNERIKELAEQATSTVSVNHEGYRGKGYTEQVEFFDKEKFAELIVQDYSRKTIQGLMSDPAFAQAMDQYYEQKWAHRFD